MELLNKTQLHQTNTAKYFLSKKQHTRGSTNKYRPVVEQHFFETTAVSESLKKKQLPATTQRKGNSTNITSIGQWQKHEPLKKKLRQTTATIIFLFFYNFIFIYFFFVRFFWFFLLAYALFFSFSKKYSLATWSTSCSTDCGNIVYIRLSTHCEPLNKNKQLLHTIALTILVHFHSLFGNKRSLQPVAKKVQGRQQRATQKQHSFCGLLNFFGRTKPACSSKIMCKAVNKRHFMRTTRNDKIKYFRVVF